MGQVPKPGEGLRKRAGQALLDLNKPEDSLAFRSQLQNLLREYDLFVEDGVHDEVVLALHKRITELADHNDTARTLLIQMCSESPVSKLFAAVLANAHADCAKEVRFDLIKEHVTCVFIDGEKTTEAMTVPVTLWHSVTGFATRLAHCGYEALMPHMSDRVPLPPFARVEDLGKDGFRIILND
jgi:hypothetical protein